MKSKAHSTFPFARLAVLGAAMLITTSPAIATPISLGKLQAGQSVSWNTGNCIKLTTDGCASHEYELTLGDGDRLRVGVDLLLDYDYNACTQSDTTDGGCVHQGGAVDLTVSVFAPGAGNTPTFSQTKAKAGVSGAGVYSVEFFVCFHRGSGVPCLPFRYEDGTPCQVTGAMVCERNNTFTDSADNVRSAAIAMSRTGSSEGGAR